MRPHHCKDIALSFLPYILYLTLFHSLFSFMEGRGWRCAYAQEVSAAPSPLEHGVDLLNKGEFEAAIGAFKEVSALNPQDPMPHYYMGLAFFRLRRYDPAIESLERALQLNPSLATAHTGLGVIYEVKGQYDLARKEYAAAVEGGDSEAQDRLKRLEARWHKERIERLRRGGALFREGRFEESLKEINAVIGQNPDDLEALFNAGVIYSRMKRYKEAIESFKKVIEIDPKNINAHLQLGLIYYSAAAYEAAEEELQAVTDIAPESKEAEEAKGYLADVKKKGEVAGYFKEASKFREKGELEAALSMAQKILSMEPENIYALYDVAVTYSIMGKEEEAIAPLKRAIEIRPEYIEARLELGVLYESLGRYEEAITEYEASSGKETEASKKAAERLETLKRYIEARERSERIKILLTGGDLTGALKEAEAYVTEEKKNPKAHLTLGRVYLRLGKIAEAIARLKMAVEIDPKYWEAYLSLGEAYEAMGKYYDAGEAYRAITSGAGDTPEGKEAGRRMGRVTLAIHFEKAKEYMGKGDFEGALREIQGVLEIAPDDPVAHFNTGVIYDRLERPEEAERFLKRAIGMSPDYVQAHLQLAFVYERGQRFDEAREEYKTILSITKEGREADIAKARLGLVEEIEVLTRRMRKTYELIRGGNYAEAQREIEDVIALSPRNYIAYYTSGIILDKMDRREEAIKALKRSLEMKEDQAAAHLYLGTVYEKENLFSDARGEYSKAAVMGEGTRDGEIATIRLKRLKNWRGNFFLSNTVDTNLSYGIKRETGIGTGYNLSLSYYLLRTKANILSVGVSGNRSITYKSQLWGEGYSVNTRWQVVPLEGYTLAAGGSYTYSIFDGQPSYRNSGFYGEAIVRPDAIPASLSMRYSFSNTDSFKNKASNASQHNVSLSASQRLSPKDTINGSYNVSSYINKDPLGSNYANRLNSLSIKFNRFIKAGLSGNASYSIGLIEYSNPDSTALFQRFRKNVTQSIGIGFLYSLSERVSMSVGYNYSDVATNLPPPSAEERQRLEDILAAPIPLVGGGYTKHTVSLGVGVAF